jgi:proteasome lid subunit RPN8/RPN11
MKDELFLRISIGNQEESDLYKLELPEDINHAFFSGRLVQGRRISKDSKFMEDMLWIAERAFIKAKNSRGHCVIEPSVIAILNGDEINSPSVIKGRRVHPRNSMRQVKKIVRHWINFQDNTDLTIGLPQSIKVAVDAITLRRLLVSEEIAQSLYDEIIIISEESGNVSVNYGALSDHAFSVGEQLTDKLLWEEENNGIVILESDSDVDQQGVVIEDQEPGKIHFNKKLPEICIRASALNRAKKHADEDTRRETGGILLGRFMSEEDGTTTVIVTGIVRGENTIRNRASLTFTPATWAKIWNLIDDDPVYSDEKKWSMVGWYHTHPSFGIFLSSRDLFIHEEYFKDPNHIALVIDPIRNDLGCFCWDLTKTKIQKHKFHPLPDEKIKKLVGIENLPVDEIQAPKG